MTQIISCLTQRTVFQVSDRRLTRDGKPVEEEETKAVQYQRSMVWGYTGLADLEGERTDLWLLGNLTPGLTESVVRIRDEATNAFNKIRGSRSRKRHAFVGVGWEQRPDTVPPPTPILVAVSNYLDQTGAPTDEARDKFNVGVYRLPPDVPFYLHVAGQPLAAHDRDVLTINMPAVIEQGDLAVAEQIVKAVQATASSTVGDRLLVGIIPRGAPLTAGAAVSMPFDPTATTSRRAKDGDPHAPKFFYVPGEGSAERTTYAPHVWTPEMQIRDAMIVDATSAPGGPDKAARLWNEGKLFPRPRQPGEDRGA